jgi:glycosyltransferase involved in cell wall biosynthesis
MRTVICAPPSAGCDNSVRILGSIIGPEAEQRGGSLVKLRLDPRNTRQALERHSTADMDVECVFFLERLVEHPALMKARHRILIPNPEWLGPRMEQLARTCTHVWHKSRDSLSRLAPIFPQAQHDYLGFTSEDPGCRVIEHASFVHLRGKLQTKRNTDSIFAAWKSGCDWPELYVHFYGDAASSIDYPGWLHDGNVHVRIGWLDRADYLDLAARHGIHLCTSEVEGFGHYINEARAMGALVIAVDGPPMNELVDDSCGILVRPSSTAAMNHGIRFGITAEDLAVAIERALNLDVDERRELGAKARARFLAEGAAFRERARELFARLM